MENYRINQQIRNNFNDETDEGIYIIREYGIQAWYDLSGSVDYSMAKRLLNQMLNNLETQERYEDCALIRDILPLFN